MVDQDQDETAKIGMPRREFSPLSASVTPSATKSIWEGVPWASSSFLRQSSHRMSFALFQAILIWRFTCTVIGNKESDRRHKHLSAGRTENALQTMLGDLPLGTWIVYRCV
jgi:hypothetical protein